MVKVCNNYLEQKIVRFETIIVVSDQFLPLDSETRLSVDERPTTSQELSIDSKLNNDQ